MLFCTVLIAGIAFCQTTPRVTISGRVLDDSTSFVLQNVDVFIARTTLGSGTNQFGQFEIRNVPLGSYEIVASRIGYALNTIRVTLSEVGPKQFTIRLRPVQIQLRTVEVPGTEPVEWKEHLKQFTKLFLGSSHIATQCKILNPEVLDFALLEGGSFAASARAPIEIENSGFGYQVRFHLARFQADYRPGGVIITVEGLPTYRELKSSGTEEYQRWTESRRKAFKGSFRHFLISLFRNRIYEDDYLMFQMPTPSPNAWDDQRMYVRREQLLTPGQKRYEKILRFREILEVEYPGEPLEEGYNLLVKNGAPGQTSWVRLNYESVTVDSRGCIKDWQPVLVYGYWAWKGVADDLPLNYDPDEE
jgi:hypothetical protein